MIYSPGSEAAVESDSLDTFLRLNESYDESEDRLAPPPQPIGVPGAASPLQMTPDRLKPQVLARPPSPLKAKVPVNKREEELNMGQELEGFGLQGVNVTEDELQQLIAELGFDEDDAGKVAKALSGAPPPATSEATVTKDSVVDSGEEP